MRWLGAMSRYRPSSQCFGSPLGPKRLMRRPPTRKSLSDSAISQPSPGTYQTFCASGSAHAAKTRAGGDVKSRSTTMVECSMEDLLMFSPCLIAANRFPHRGILPGHRDGAPKWTVVSRSNLPCFLERRAGYDRCERVLLSWFEQARLFREFECVEQLPVARRRTAQRVR